MPCSNSIKLPCYVHVFLYIPPHPNYLIRVMLADDDRSSHSPVPLLFSDDNDDETTEMLPLESKTPIIREDISPPSASAPGPSAGALASRHETNPAAGPAPVYRVYKRRFFGLFQLVLLNIIVSWDVCGLPCYLECVLMPVPVANLLGCLNHCFWVL